MHLLHVCIEGISIPRYLKSPILYEGLCVRNACGAVSEYTTRAREGSVGETRYVGGLLTVSDSQPLYMYI